MILKNSEFLTRFFEEKKLKKKAKGIDKIVAKKAIYIVSMAEKIVSLIIAKLGVAREKKILWAPRSPSWEKNSLKDTWLIKRLVIKVREK